MSHALIVAAGGGCCMDQHGSRSRKSLCEGGSSSALPPGFHFDCPEGSRAVRPPAQSHGRAAPGASLLPAVLSLWAGLASVPGIKH